MLPINTGGVFPSLSVSFIAQVVLNCVFIFRNRIHLYYFYGNTVGVDLPLLDIPLLLL